MDDLISRQAAIDAICKACANGDDYVKCVERRPESTFCDEIVALRKLPSEESERKKGEWIATYLNCGGDVWVSWKCSNCGYIRKKGWKYTDDGKNPDALFCEMCNADMRGEQDDSI